MKINFIGTGSGKTSLKRYHSSLLVSSDNHNLLIDCGDGISRALLQQNIDFNSINSILISHFHADHYTGLASLITQMKMLGRSKDLIIYSHSSLINYLEEFLFHSYIFRERLGFKLNVIPIEVEEKILVNSSLSFYVKQNSHLDKYKINDVDNKLSFPSLSFLFKDDNKSFIYTGDIGSSQDLYLYNEKTDWIITEISHINLYELLPLLRQHLTGQIVLTHIDDESVANVEKFINSLNNEEKSKFIIAYDGYILQHNS